MVPIPDLSNFDKPLILGVCFFESAGMVTRTDIFTALEGGDD